MPSLELEFEASCAKCGSDLVSETGSTARHGPFVKVSPCENCMRDEYERGHDTGREEAEAAAEQ